jgi:type IV pilus assembly protein PilV
MTGCGNGYETGSSLVELLVAVTVFAIGLLAVAGMQLTALRGNASAQRASVASGLAEGVLEEILSWPDDHPQLATDAVDQEWLLAAATPADQLPGAGNYRALYAIDADYNRPKLTRVEVRVEALNAPARPVSLVAFKRCR